MGLKGLQSFMIIVKENNGYRGKIELILKQLELVLLNSENNKTRIHYSIMGLFPLLISEKASQKDIIYLKDKILHYLLAIKYDNDFNLKIITDLYKWTLSLDKQSKVLTVINEFTIQLVNTKIDEIFNNNNKEEFIINLNNSINSSMIDIRSTIRNKIVQFIKNKVLHNEISSYNSLKVFEVMFNNDKKKNSFFFPFIN